MYSSLDSVRSAHESHPPVLLPLDLSVDAPSSELHAQQLSAETRAQQGSEVLAAEAVNDEIRSGIERHKNVAELGSDSSARDEVEAAHDRVFLESCLQTVQDVSGHVDDQADDRYHDHYGYDDGDVTRRLESRSVDVSGCFRVHGYPDVPLGATFPQVLWGSNLGSVWGEVVLAECIGCSQQEYYFRVNTGEYGTRYEVLEADEQEDPVDHRVSVVVKEACVLVSVPTVFLISGVKK